MGELEGKRTPSNTSIISAARRVNVPLAVEIADTMSSTTNVNAMGRYSYDYEDLGATAEDLYEDPVAFNNVKNILRKWDLGLDDITIEKEEKVDVNGEKETYYLLNGIHIKEDGTKFALPFAFESAGTQSAFIRLHNIMQCLKKEMLALLMSLEMICIHIWLNLYLSYLLVKRQTLYMLNWCLLAINLN